jgi:ATP-binding cassette, subfamily B, bacterial
MAVTRQPHPALARVPRSVASRARLWHASLAQAANRALGRSRRRRRASSGGRAREATAGRCGELALWQRLARQAKPCWPHLAGLAVLSLLATPLALLTPVPLKIAVDNVIGDEPLPGVFQALLPGAATNSDTAALVLAAALLIGIAVARQLQELGTTSLRAYTGERLVLGFRGDLFQHAQGLSLAYHDSKGTADAAYRIQSDAAAVRYIAVDGLIPLLAAAVTLCAMLYVTARISWQLALVALTVAPVLLVIGWAYRRRLRRGWREVKGIESTTLGVVQEVLTSLRIVKVFGQEGRERERFLRHSHEGMRARVRLALTEGGFGLLVGVTTAVGAAAVLVIGVRQVQEGALTLGSLLLVMAYLSQLYEPVRTIGSKTASLQSHLASAERAFALLDEAPEVPEQASGGLRLTHASGAITFQNVSFSYGDGRSALEGVSFDIAAGTRLGISGATGAGKTTLVNLLTRFYDPTAGVIRLDGYDLRAYKLADLRRQFGIALQDPLLFSASIAENIAYARPKAHLRDVVRAAKAANADTFIRALPQGYETQVGERGLSLSGGERQRIALARAFLKNAPILILDEPTSSVDAETEEAMIEAMQRLSRGRTAFVIAHRPSVLAICGAYVHIDGGRLVEVQASG